MNKFSVVNSESNLRPLARLAMPALAEEFLVLMVTWTDWWLAGHYFQHDGDATKAAMGLMGYVMWLIPAMFSAAAIGATALVARWMGSGDHNLARRTANQAFVIGAVFALMLTTLALLFGRDFILLLQLKGTAADYADQYFRIVAPVIPLIMCSQIGAACLRGAGDTVTGFVAKSVVVVINIVISAVLVSGWGTFPQVGWQGLAIGTAAGHCVGGILILSVLIRGRAGLKLRMRWLRPDFSIIRKILRIGVPGGFDMATLLFSQLIFLGLINSLGSAAAAAHGLAVQIEACCFLPGAAFQTAAATMSGQFLGAGLKQRASRSALLCLGCGGLIMCSFGALVFLYGHWFAYFFTGSWEDPTTGSTAQLLKIVAVAMPSLAVVMILTGTLRGAGDTLLPFFFTAVGFFVVRIPLAAWLAFDAIDIGGWEIGGYGFGVQGAWYAMVADLAVRSILVGGRFATGGWKRIEV